MLRRDPSSDLNPIENAFAKLKHLMRKAQSPTVEAAWTSIGQLLPSFSQEECRNYFLNAGYAPS